MSDGAGRENRTLMVLPPRDFESRASTNSAIPARGAELSRVAKQSDKLAFRVPSPITRHRNSSGQDELPNDRHEPLGRVVDHSVAASREPLEAHEVRR